MVQASAQLQRTFMQTPQLHCSCCCCSTQCSLSRMDPPVLFWLTRSHRGDALHPGLPWHYCSHQVLHWFHLSTEAWLGFNKKHWLDLSSHFFSSSPWNSDNWLFHLIKYLHSLVLAHPALPGAARAPLALQGRQCSPKWASQHSSSSHKSLPQPAPSQRPLSSCRHPRWAHRLGMVLPQVQPLAAPASRAGLSHGGTCKTSRGLWQLPLGFTCKGNISTSAGARGCGTAGSDTRVTGGAGTALDRTSSQLLPGSGHALGATHSIHTRKGGATPAGNAAISK